MLLGLIILQQHFYYICFIRNMSMKLRVILDILEKFYSISVVSTMHSQKSAIYGACRPIMQTLCHVSHKVRNLCGMAVTLTKIIYLCRFILRFSAFLSGMLTKYLLNARFQNSDFVFRQLKPGIIFVRLCR